MELIVTYKLTMFDPFLGAPFVCRNAKLNSVAALRTSIQKQTAPNTQFIVSRIINVVDGNYVKDTDTKHPYTEFLDGKPIRMREPGGQFNFFVSNNIQYPRDIHALLLKKYGKSYDFSPLFDLNTPMIITNITEEICGNKKYANVNWRALNNEDVVVNKNMHQIWPDTTGRCPADLIALLKRKTEKLY